jgi:hypothetical protein
MKAKKSESGCDPEYSAEAVRIHEFLVNRIAARAQAEGTPLPSSEMEQFESQRMSKDESRRFHKDFGGMGAWQPFLDKISGLLKRAIEEDAVSDPTAPARYEAMVHDLEDRWESFSLWACCVPAIPGYKSSHKLGFRDIFVLLLVAAGIVVLVLHLLKIL